VIDRAALEHNFKEVVRCAEGQQVLAVVKAGAYGHGAVEVSKRLLTLGADMLGVALVEEGRELRDAGIHAPILVMGATFPEQAEAMVSLKLTPAIFSLAVAKALSEAAYQRRTTINIHVKIDTGMGRIGISPEDAPEFIAVLRKMGSLSVQGLMTHFADADLRDKQFASRQMDRFEGLLNALEAKKISVPMRHAKQRLGARFSSAFFTMVRPGLMLYGYNPLEEGTIGADLRQVLSLVTRIAFIKKVPPGVPISYGRTFTTKRESIIATLPIGYADGYCRGLSNKGVALVRGMRVPVVGRVCMDMCMIDVTDVPNACEGDDVVLIGSQGSERITADDIAAMTGTIAYEVLCGISNRVPRIYQ
jgi:alanine racemase